MSLLLYLALGGLAAAVMFGLSTDVRAAARRLFSSSASVARERLPHVALRTLGGRLRFPATDPSRKGYEGFSGSLPTPNFAVSFAA